MLTIDVDRQDERITVLTLDGRLDLASAADLKQAVAEVIAGGKSCFVVDLQWVSFVDSSGLGALISGLKSAREAGGNLRIARPSEQARLILQLTALERVLHPYATLEEARTEYA